MSRLTEAALALSLAVALAGAGGVSAWAQEHHDHGGPGGAPPPHGHGPGFHGGPGIHGGPGFHPGFHGRDFAHFTPAEHAAWVGGAWHHGWYGGRFGWWWAVGGLWYYYPAPIYPYPEYVADLYYDPSLGEPPAAPVEPAAGAPGYWYYCAPSGAYYPYVQSCPAPWTPVAPTPPQQ